MSKKAFTLIEAIVVVIILSILAAVSIPVFQNIQGAARNTTTRAAVTSIRSAIAQYRQLEIAAGRAVGDAADPGWPLTSQIFDPHCGAPIEPHIMINSSLPPNPWASVSPIRIPGQADCVFTCAAACSQGDVAVADTEGWVYKPSTGEFWANTAENDGSVPVGDENCAGDPPTENCF